MKAVTTFSPRGYRKYGKKCLESLIRNWPSEIGVFYEEKPDLEHEKLIYVPLNSIPERQEFLKLAENIPGSDGMVEREKAPTEYNFMRDALKYCHKAFCQMAVEDDHVFWIDADTVVFKEIQRDFLVSLFDGHPYCYFGRGMYTETGFLGFNQTHQLFPLLKRQYINCYTKGVLFSMLGWHDCFAFDYARIGIEGNNLSPLGKGTEHVIATSILGDYLDHLKGNRKNLGHSPEQKVQWW